MSELKPCPFCGAEAEIRTETFGGVVFYAWCDNCETRGDYYCTEAEAITAWNTRMDERYVERRECANVGWYIDNTRFKCSECGYNGWVKFACDGRDRVPSFCPSCGAKVVS